MPGTDTRRSSPAVAGDAALAVVRLDSRGDGIAYVGRLLLAALTDLTGAPPALLQLAPSTTGRVSKRERARFAAALLRRQLMRSDAWWIFNHVGIARAQRIVPAFLRPPYAVFLNGVEAWDPEMSRDRLQTLSHAKTLIAISDHTAKRAREAHPALPPIQPCLLGLMPPDAPDGPPDHALLDRIAARSVLIVGRTSSAERYKGHDELLDCWSEVTRKIPAAQLVMTGAGDDLPRLRQKAAQLELRNVVFTGFVSNSTLTALRQRVRAFAMPSRGEGFGLVYLEAMRAGLPCIGSTVDAAVDVIVDGETGYLVDPGDRNALAGRIVALLSDPALCTALGTAGQRRYQTRFTYERFRERLRPILVNAFGEAPVTGGTG
jgi:phosphatidylinositol alpha-1,6-mannosyltransferase